MSVPKLGYWDIQGLGQPLRILFAYLNLEYEDIVYDNTTRETTWATDIKPNLGLDFPNLPYYLDGNIKLTNPLAIIRYLGRKHNLYGNSMNESSIIDMLIDQASVMKQSLNGIAYNPYHPGFVSLMFYYKSMYLVSKMSHFRKTWEKSTSKM